MQKVIVFLSGPLHEKIQLIYIKKYIIFSEQPKPKHSEGIIWCKWSCLLSKYSMWNLVAHISFRPGTQVRILKRPKSSLKKDDIPLSSGGKKYRDGNGNVYVPQLPWFVADDFWNMQTVRDTLCCSKDSIHLKFCLHLFWLRILFNSNRI